MPGKSLSVDKLKEGETYTFVPTTGYSHAIVGTLRGFIYSSYSTGRLVLYPATYHRFDDVEDDVEGYTHKDLSFIVEHDGETKYLSILSYRVYPRNYKSKTAKKEPVKKRTRRYKKKTRRFTSQL